MIEYDDGEVVVISHAKEHIISPPILSQPIPVVTSLRSSSTSTQDLAAEQAMSHHVIAEFDPLIPQDWMINFASSPNALRQMSAAGAVAKDKDDQDAPSASIMTPRVRRVPYANGVAATPQPCLLDSLSNEFVSPPSMAKYSEKDLLQWKKSVQDQVSRNWTGTALLCIMRKG